MMPYVVFNGIALVTLFLLNLIAQIKIDDLTKRFNVLSADFIRIRNKADNTPALGEVKSIGEIRLPADNPLPSSESETKGPSKS